MEKSWKDENVVNNSLINDLTQRVSGFKLPRAMWSALNRIRTKQGICKFLLLKWKMGDTLLFEFGLVQTIKHIVETCSRKKYEGEIKDLHKGGSEAQDWLRNLEYTFRKWARSYISLYVLLLTVTRIIKCYYSHLCTFLFILFYLILFRNIYIL